VREIPIMHSVRGAMQPIGSLYVEATLDEVYRALLDKALVILVSQGAKTFLVSLFILYIFHRLVTRHLTAIGATLRSRAAAASVISTTVPLNGPDGAQVPIQPRSSSCL